MPKMKTNRGAAKRFRRTAKGFKHKRTGKNHFFTKKPQKRKRQLRGFKDVSPADRKSVDRMLPGKAR
ncbi:MAG: 50S ribosomal protein L35 [Pseudomonadales bacterium]